MFTLSGGHVFPLYDAVVKDGAGAAMRLVDVRHEQTAVFAAEAIARLTRTPGLAVVTAGPGVTNSVSAVTTAWFNGAPVVVLAGRAPDSHGRSCGRHRHLLRERDRRMRRRCFLVRHGVRHHRRLPPGPPPLLFEQATGRVRRLLRSSVAMNDPTWRETKRAF